MKHPQSFTSSSLSQHPISAANGNPDRASCQDHSEIWGFYKPARIDPRQDLTATRYRENISGSGLSSPALQQPPTKPFSGSPARQLMTGPHREAREAEGERPGIIYPLLPRAARPDTQLQIGRRLARSCCPRSKDSAAHGVGHRRTQADDGIPATGIALAPAPIPQAMPQSLHGGLQTFQALAPTRSLV